MGIIIAASLGLVCGFGIAWLICRKLPQEKIRGINYQRIEEEQNLFAAWQEEMEIRRREKELEIQQIEDRRKNSQQNYEDSNKKVDEILLELNSLQIQQGSLSAEVAHLQTQRADISNSIEQSKKDAEETAKTFYNQQMSLAIEQFDRAVEEAALRCQQNISDYDTIYSETLAEAMKGFQEQMAIFGEQSARASATLQELQNAIDVAVAAAKREEEMRQQQNFYRLIIPESDMNEIKQLRSVAPYHRDKEALNKVIWKVYYEKPYTDMIGRVLGAGVKTGIYKITNIENQMCYVGQAVNAADRWKQHIKRGLGAEAPTRNKLYPAMAEFGVENFTFELLEECSKDKLDQQEDFWQDFFHAKDYGYSIK